AQRGTAVRVHCRHCGGMGPPRPPRRSVARAKPMRIAYIVLAHDPPNHLGRLLRALDTPWSSSPVHIDRKADISLFRQALSPGGVRPLIRRIEIAWEDYSVVEAIVLLMRGALSVTPTADYFVLLSGSCYPLRSNEYIRSFLQARHGPSFSSVVRMPCPEAGKPLDRLTKYKPYAARTVGNRLRQLYVSQLHALGLMSPVQDYRPYLRPLQPFGGSTWWALTHEACAHALRFIDRERRGIRLYPYRSHAGESLLPTIVGNSAYMSTVVPNFTYADWSAGGRHPAEISAAHVSAFRDARRIMCDDAYGPREALFARKFPDHSEQLVQSIDDMRARSDVALASEEFQTPRNPGTP